jgi:hypothetical protein
MAKTYPPYKNVDYNHMVYLNKEEMRNIVYALSTVVSTGHTPNKLFEEIKKFDDLANHINYVLANIEGGK